MTTGSTNVVLGSGAGAAITAGSGNVTIGASANPSANGSSGTIVGSGGRGGASGVYMGNSVGNASLTGANNTCLGFSVCHTTLTTGTSNLLIGVNNNVDTAASGTTHGLVIGTQASLTAASNALNIEGIITATGTGTPSTSVTTVAGNTTLTGATVLMPGLANVATTSALCFNTGTGLLTFDGTIGTCTVSDERLKNMGERVPNALDRILQINGVYYTWKDPKLGVGNQIGVGAQTVEKVFPELVSTDSEGKKSVDYQRLTAPIIEALRELKADNDNLRQEVNRLKRRTR